MSVRRLLATVTVCVLAVAPAVAAAPLAPTTVPILSTTTSPFASCADDLPDFQRSLGAVDFANSEVEPYLAVNPTNPENLIAVWQQDRWNVGGGSRGNLAGVSLDGGDNWTVVEVTHSSACTGNGFWARATDPWVTFSPDGTAYFMHLSIYSPLVGVPETFGLEAMLVSRSLDGGLTWEEPKELVRDTSPTSLHDKNSITADPNDAGYVYAVWDQLVFPPSDNGNLRARDRSNAFTGDTIFTRSTDGGQTWEPIRTILETAAHEQTIGNQIVVRPANVGAQLVNVFDLIHETSNANKTRGLNVAVQISSDHGASWSKPIVAVKMLPAPTLDPDTGTPVRTLDIGLDAAVDPTNGDLFAVWQDASFSGGAYNDVALIASGDGGNTWSTPIFVPRTLSGVAGLNRQAFNPQVHVSGDGRLAVSYYDFRMNDGTGPSEVDYFVNQCASPDASESDLCNGDWVETRVTAQSFDIRTAVLDLERGFFVGDYVGLAEVPGAFATAFSISSAGDPATVHYSTVPFAP